MEKTDSFITYEVSFCQNIFELLVGVDILNLNLKMKIDSIRRVIHVSLLDLFKSLLFIWITASLYSTVYDIVSNKTSHSTKRRSALLRSRFFVLGWNVGIILGVLILCVHDTNLFPLVWLRICRLVSTLLSYIFSVVELVLKNESLLWTSVKDQELDFRQFLNPVSRERISTSVVLCETEVYLKSIQLHNMNLRLSKMHKSPPDFFLDGHDAHGVRDGKWHMENSRMDEIETSSHMW